MICDRVTFMHLYFFLHELGYKFPHTFSPFGFLACMTQVNAVEVALQLDIDLSDFRRIEHAEIRTIVRPKYNRRSLSFLRSRREYPTWKALSQDDADGGKHEKPIFVEESEATIIEETK